MTIVDYLIFTDKIWTLKSEEKGGGKGKFSHFSFFQFVLILHLKFTTILFFGGKN